MVAGTGHTVEVRALCDLLVTRAVVSYRGIPRILELFNATTALALGWVPHFTSVINWTLRLGLGLLKHVKAVDCPWLAIVDHSIDICTKKALFVLRVRLDALPEGVGDPTGRLQMHWPENPRTRQRGRRLGGFGGDFRVRGKPFGYCKGLRRHSEKRPQAVVGQASGAGPCQDGIGHVMAGALREEFEGTAPYRRFTALATRAANRLRQTDLAFLMPPKLLSKGRLQSIATLAKWGEKVLGKLAVKGRARQGSPLARLRTALPGFSC